MAVRQRQHEQDPMVRRTNFDAVESNLTDEQAKLEAARCLNCKNPRCVQGCPVNINIPGFISALKEGDLEKSGEIIRESSLLPSVCGRVCPQERQCESKCVLGIKSEPIAMTAKAISRKPKSKPTTPAEPTKTAIGKRPGKA